MIKKIAHRVLSINCLKDIPGEIGIEFDVHAYGKEIVVTHEPFENGINLEEFLKEAGNRFLAVNIKEEGIEENTISILKKMNYKNFFLFDINPPQIFRLGKTHSSNLAFRISQLEKINIEKCRKFASYLWIDTFDGTLWPPKEFILELKKLKYNLCFVSPELHRPPIGDYKYFNSCLNAFDDLIDSNDFICTKYI